MPVRLGKPPKAANKHVTKSMRANKARDTKPELALRRLLLDNGMGGYRLNWKKAPGRPDICYPGKKIAIFVNGCFWHRCPKCDLPLPKSNQDFWITKFSRNMERDRLKNKRLRVLGWKTLTAWECELEKMPGRLIKRIKKYFETV
ncbi:very short patch repair endonuclease [Candidatus Peregrinibacteria bacterium]|nr:very short patch repair endonuclease [Candidatus Peregrinibacteria bacterium]